MFLSQLQNSYRKSSPSHTSPWQTAPKAGHSLHERGKRQLCLHPPDAGQALGGKLRHPDLQALPAQSARQYSLTEVLDLSGGCNAGTPCCAVVPGFIGDFMEQGVETERNSVKGNPPPHLPHPGNNHQDSAEWQSLGNLEEMSFNHIPFIFLLDFTYKIGI